MTSRNLLSEVIGLHCSGEGGAGVNKADGALIGTGGLLFLSLCSACLSLLELSINPSSNLQMFASHLCQCNREHEHRGDVSAAKSSRLLKPNVKCGAGSPPCHVVQLELRISEGPPTSRGCTQCACSWRRCGGLRCKSCQMSYTSQWSEVGAGVSPPMFTHSSHELKQRPGRRKDIYEEIIQPADKQSCLQLYVTPGAAAQAKFEKVKVGQRRLFTGGNNNSPHSNIHSPLTCVIQ